MEDKSKKQPSPLDELRSINERVQQNKELKPSVTVGDDSIEISNAPRTAPSAPAAASADISRAEKVRLARQNAEQPPRAASNPQVASMPPRQPHTSGAAQAPAPQKNILHEPDNAKTRVTSAVSAQKPAPAASVPAVPQADKSAPENKKSGSGAEYSTAFEETVGRGVISSAMKAVIYIVCLLVVSGCLSLIVVFVANDAFAFVKSGEEVTINLSEDANLSDIADILGEKKIIKYPAIFKLYVTLRHKTADDYISGDFIVSPQMGYDMLISKFTPSRANRQEISITIIEGMDIDEIIDLFIENGIGTREGFVDVIQNYDFDFWFVDELDAQIAANPESGRIYRLEGYLFPDTYNFYNTASEEDVIYKLLDNFNAKFDEDKRARARELGYTADQVITLASIVQKEAKFVTDYANVASVFYNRLRNTSATAGKLESNATVQYTMPDEEVELALSIAQIQSQDNAYNTYLYAGLPVGAICNPSLNALNWALYPADTNYYYFVSDASGYNLYATTWPQHEANVASVENAG